MTLPTRDYAAESVGKYGRIRHDPRTANTIRVLNAYADGVLMSRAEWLATVDYRCAKCGRGDVSMRYVTHRNRLECRCFDCKYEWSEEPKDAVVDAAVGVEEGDEG